MSILFDDASSQYLEKDVNPLTTYPFTFACWFRSDDITVSQVLMALADKSAPDEYATLIAAGGEPSDPVRAAAVSSAAFSLADTSTGFFSGVWHHAAGVWLSTSSIKVYIDGGSEGTDTTLVTPTASDRTSIGRLGDSTPSLYMSGRIAEAAIWDNRALILAEIVRLAKGLSSWYMHPSDLVGYWPLWGHTPNALDLSGSGNSLAHFNSPQIANHAPVNLFTPKWAATAPLPGGRIMSSLAHHGGLVGQGGIAGYGGGLAG